MKFRYGRLAGVVVIVGLLLIGFLLITSGAPKKPSAPVSASKPLIDYAASNATVSLTIKGAINAKENHREIRVTVGRDYRELEVIKGYNNRIISDKTYNNTKEAYSEFLYALTYARFTKQRDSDVKTEQGVCALGNRYVFKLEQGGQDISRLWTSTCSGIGRGTFSGSYTLVLTLFEEQIPDYDKLTQRVDLR